MELCLLDAELMTTSRSFTFAKCRKRRMTFDYKVRPGAVTAGKHYA